MNYCPYCLAPVATSRRYCEPEHARRARNERARAAGQLRRLHARVRRHAQQVALESERWRAGAAGRKTLEQLVAEVFGVSEIPAMRDTAE